jgi:transposase
MKNILKQLTDEKYARKYFLKKRWKKYLKFCQRCGGRKLYRLSNKKYRCSRCKFEFTDFTNTFLGQLRISLTDWLLLIKLFDLEVSARRAVKEVGLSYPTVYKAYVLIRIAIYFNEKDSRHFRGEIELDESYFGGKRKGKRGRGAGHKVPVFGILERNGKVFVTVIKDVSAQSLIGETVKKVKRGSIVYTDKWKSYDSLMFCSYRHMNVDHGERFASGKVHINGLEGFWSFAKQRLAKFHGVLPRKFPLYIKEMEFRYNHRDEDIFEILVNYVIDLVPNPT